MGLACAKCGRNAYSVVRVKMKPKYGSAYWYDRYVHPDKRKDSGVRYCYVRVKVP